MDEKEQAFTSIDDAAVEESSLEGQEVLDEVEDESLTDLEKAKKELALLDDNKKNAGKITASRGRLISKLKAEIKKIKKEENLKAKDLDKLEELEIRLEEELEKHKKQLAGRYSDEFIHEKATFKAVITVLPKGVGLQAKKVANCIEELKAAKSNKERIFKVLDLAKQFGLLAATPVIFTAKFVVRHWYLLLLLLLLLLHFELPKVDVKKPSLDPDAEPSYEPVQEPVTSPVKEPVTSHVKDPVTNPVNEPVKVPVKEPVTAPLPNVVAVDADNTVTNTQPDVVVPSTSVEVDGVTGAAPSVSRDISTGNVTDTLIGGDTAVIAPVSPTTTTVPVSYFDLLRQTLPPDVQSGYTIFNTIEDAAQYARDEMGWPEWKIQEFFYDGNGDYLTNSIRWLVGKNGMFGETLDDALKNYSQEDLLEIVNAQQQDIIDFTNLFNVDPVAAGEMLKNGGIAILAAAALGLLAYGTGGLSLVISPEIMAALGGASVIAPALVH